MRGGAAEGGLVQTKAEACYNIEYDVHKSDSRNAVVSLENQALCHTVPVAMLNVVWMPLALHLVRRPYIRMVDNAEWDEPGILFMCFEGNTSTKKSSATGVGLTAVSTLEKLQKLVTTASSTASATHQ